MLRSVAAPVRPRFLSVHIGESLLLEEEVRALIERGGPIEIEIVGRPGSGKTTALEHLAAVLPPNSRVLFVDEGMWCSKPTSSIVPAYVRTASIAQESPGCRVLRLAGWGSDELIEYLLSKHKEQCASVIARIGRSDRAFLRGIPELWHIALDAMAADPTLRNPNEALLRFLDSELEKMPDPPVGLPYSRRTVDEVRQHLQRACLLCLIKDFDEQEQRYARAWAELREEGVPESVVRLLRHKPIQLLLGAERIADDAATLDHLRREFEFTLGRQSQQAMIASLLHLADSGWVPTAATDLMLTFAYLEGVKWPEMTFRRMILNGADLTGADLRRSQFRQCCAESANLHNALLDEAVLEGLEGWKCDFSGASLRRAQAENAVFAGANFQDANLDDCSILRTSFEGANLRGASLRNAQLANSNFKGARLEGADFSNANLEGASFEGLILRNACFAGANFPAAILNKCDLEEMELDRMDFSRAELDGALLTGASMAGARFANASLRNAGLADVNWEGADLREADLRGSTFHMGSSRSGMLFTPIPSEGSRTGFYTDDFGEQTFKSPEEIRKANLCGADLRGALCGDVDFYLVDLRRALYDPIQGRHFRRCGAILEDP